MPSTVFPAPGTFSASREWSTYTETATASSSGTTVTLVGRTIDPGQTGSSVSVTSGTGQFASNTIISSAAYINTYSASFNGSTQYLTVPSTGTNAAFTFAGNFTVEGWFYPTLVTGSDRAIFCLGTEAANRYVWYITSAGQIASNLFGAATRTYTVSPAIVANTWNHISVVRSGSTVTVYVNGTASATTDTQAGTIGNGVVRIGSDSGGSANFQGYASNFRVVAGVAVYTGTFTLPTTALAATQLANANGNPSAAITGSQSSVLTCQSPTIIDNGIANAGVGFTIGNAGTITTIASTVSGNTFTVNMTPTVALSSATISISTQGVITAPDNRRTVAKASAGLQAKSITDNRRVITNLQKQLTVARSITDNRRVITNLQKQIAVVRSITDNSRRLAQVERPWLIRSDQIAAITGEDIKYDAALLQKQMSLVKGITGEDVKYDAALLQKQIAVVRSITDNSRRLAQVQNPFLLKSDQIAAILGEDVKYDAALLQKQIAVVRSTVNIPIPNRIDDLFPQSSVSTRFAPTNAREALYYFNLSPGLRAANRANFASNTNDERAMFAASLQKQLVQVKGIPGENVKFNAGAKASSVIQARSTVNIPIPNRIDNLFPQSAVSTRLAPTNAREALYYFNLSPGLRAANRANFASNTNDERAMFVAGKASAMTRAVSITGEDFKYDATLLQRPITVVVPMPGEDVKFDVNKLETGRLVRSDQIAAMPNDQSTTGKAASITRAVALPGEDVKYDAALLQKPITVVVSIPGEDIKYDTNLLQKPITKAVSAVQVPSNYNLSTFGGYYIANTIRMAAGTSNPRNQYLLQTTSISSVGGTTTISAKILNYSVPAQPLPVAGETFLFTDAYGRQATATIQGNPGPVSFVLGAAPITVPLGQALFAGGTVSGTGGAYVGTIGTSSTSRQYQYTWTCPDNVYTVSVVCIGAGGGLIQGTNAGAPYGSGAGGATFWANNIPVVPGTTYTIYSGLGGNGPASGSGGASTFTAGSNFITAGGGGNNGGLGGTYSFALPAGITYGGGAGGRGWVGINGGNSLSGGGGAGGYAGNGGDGGRGDGTGGIAGAAGANAAALSGGGGGGGASGGYGAGGGGGGGVGPNGIGVTGTGGAGGNATGTISGSGGGGGSAPQSSAGLGFPGEYGGGGAIDNLNYQFNGAKGAVRIIWPGNKLADGSTVRSFGATGGTTVLATDQSGTISDGVPVITFTVNTSDVAALDATGTWNLASWDMSLVPQYNVVTNTYPANAREALYFFNMAPGARSANRSNFAAGYSGEEFRLDPNYVQRLIVPSFQVTDMPYYASNLGKASAGLQARAISGEYERRRANLLERSRLLRSDQISAMPNDRSTTGKASASIQASAAAHAQSRFLTNLLERSRLLRSDQISAMPNDQSTTGKASAAVVVKDLPANYVGSSFGKSSAVSSRASGIPNENRMLDVKVIERVKYTLGLFDVAWRAPVTVSVSTTEPIQFWN